MLEVCFGDSAKGTLMLAQHCGGDVIAESVGVVTKPVCTGRAAPSCTLSSCPGRSGGPTAASSNTAAGPRSSPNGSAPSSAGSRCCRPTKSAPWPGGGRLCRLKTRPCGWWSRAGWSALASITTMISSGRPSRTSPARRHRSSERRWANKKCPPATSSSPNVCCTSLTPASSPWCSRAPRAFTPRWSSGDERLPFFFRNRSGGLRLARGCAMVVPNWTGRNRPCTPRQERSP